MGVSTVFVLSAFAGFGTDPTSSRPADIAPGFEPRPFAMAYSVREAVAQARADRQFAGVVAALESASGRREADRSAVPMAAYRASGSESGLDRFDAFVAGTLALDPGASVPLPTTRPVGLPAPRP